MREKSPAVISAILEKILLRQGEITLPINPRSKEFRTLAKNVRTISDEYAKASAANIQDIYTKPHLLKAYLLYYMPANLVKIFPVLNELFCHPEITPCEGTLFSVLDLGCGPGTFLLGVVEYLAGNYARFFSSVQEVELWGIDQFQPTLSAARTLLDEHLSSGIFVHGIHGHSHLKHGSITSPQFPHPLLPKEKQFDLIIAGNVLSELSSETFSFLAPVLANLISPKGSLVLIDPGMKRSSRNLIRFSNCLLENTSLHRYSPCLHHGACPALDTQKDWCHEKLFWTPPEIIRAIDLITGFTKEKGLRYSYFTFRKDRKHIFGLYGNGSNENFWRVVSYPIRNKGEERLHLCNGREKVVVRRLNRNNSEHNRDFSSAQRGDCVFFDQGIERKEFIEVTRNSVFRIMELRNET